MAAVVHQRCFHHSLREAVARCPECRHFYCRECITEHEDRVICAACLKKITAAITPKRISFAWAWPFVQFTLGFVIVWFVFYLFGEMLLSIPSSYHEGNVWIDNFWR